MIKKIFLILLVLLPITKIGATVYYIDFTNGSDSNTGLGSTSALAFKSLNQFGNNARSAGDIAFVRRGQASTTNVTAVTFTSDGTLNSPITISADYDNIWNDDATTTETYTPTFGSKFMASSASSTSAFKGRWIYVQGDCNQNYNTNIINECAYAYEIASSTPNGLQLYLPYKGAQSGAGKNLRVMLPAPQVGITTTANQIFTMSSDDYWKFKGLDLRSTAATCVTNTASNKATYYYDMIFQGNGATDCPGTWLNSSYLKKSRFFGFSTGFNNIEDTIIDDFLADCNNVASSYFFQMNAAFGMYFNFYNIEIKNCINDILSSAAISYKLNIRNAIFNNNLSTVSGNNVQSLYYEDMFSVPGLNAQSSNQIANDRVATTTMATTTNLRVGGGPKNEVVFPPSGTGNTGLSTTTFPYSFIKLFEYPIYASASKTYTMYFNSTTTAGWVSDPLASELWIECEYYGDATDAHRFLKKSTDLVDFNGSTAWQPIAVTCAPSQAGILYLRGWYGKQRETANSNIFYMDTTPVIN